MIKKEHWFSISFWDEEETTAKLEKAYRIGYEVHVWVVETINEYWQKNLVLPKFSEFRPLAASRITGSEWVKHVQRYTLDRIVEHTFAHALSQMRIGKKRKNVTLAKPMPYADFKTIQIEARKIWRKHLAEDRGIATAFGIIFPEGSWKKTIREQIGNLDPMIIPYLWHSLTIQKSDEGWKARFNFHDINSQKGKEAKRELKKDAEDLLSE